MLKGVMNLISPFGGPVSAAIISCNIIPAAKIRSKALVQEIHQFKIQGVPINVLNLNALSLNEANLETYSVVAKWSRLLAADLTASDRKV